ncbi:MAG: serpin family protein [Bacteroidales bacterium]|jgi:serine protease inhibitor|nr:serpin family protein [Bacteroidales bacterium]
MSKLKQKVQQDFIEKTGVTFSFDTTKLESNPLPAKKPFNRKRLLLIVPSAIVVSLVLVVGAVTLSALLTTNESVRLTRKKYSAEEIVVIESNTFKRLNTINYPLLTGSRYVAMNENEITHYNEFANKIYQALDFKENTTFAPVNLYPLLSALAMGTSSAELETSFAALFGNLNESNRTTLYQKIFKNNYYHNELGSSFLHNGAFVNHEVGFKEDYLNKLTAHMFEAFSLDYTSEQDIRKMMTWINDAMQEEDFLKRGDLDITPNTLLYLFSTFLFSNQWTNKYYENANTNAPFLLKDGNKTNTKFMTHTYFGTYFDYPNYVSVYDYYTNENYVQYLVPKTHNDNIYDLLGNTNFLFETGEEHNLQTIELTAPIFTTKSIIDFENPLTKLGLGDMFDAEQDSFRDMFLNEPLTTYVDSVIQKNEISFNVDGTTIKSLAFAGAKSAAPFGDTLEVHLDQPFIYVIRDINNIPLFIGQYDNPNK